MEMHAQSLSKQSQIIMAKYLDFDKPTRIFTLSSPLMGLVTQNFMMAPRHIVTKYIKKQVYNWVNINLWNDSLNDHTTLNNCQEVQSVIPVFIQTTSTS